MPSLGGWEWVILAVVALLLFGGKRLAGIGKSAGQAIREFREETTELKNQPVEPPAITPPPAQPVPPATEQPTYGEPKPAAEA